MSTLNPIARPEVRTVPYAGIVTESVVINTESIFEELRQVDSGSMTSSNLREDFEFFKQSITQCENETTINWQSWVNWLLELSSSDSVVFNKTCRQLHIIKESIEQHGLTDEEKQSVLSKLTFQLHEINRLNTASILIDIELAKQESLSIYQSIRLRLLVNLVTDYVNDTTSQCSADELDHALIELGKNSSLSEQFQKINADNIKLLVLKFAPQLGIVLGQPDTTSFTNYDYETLKELERQVEIMCSDAQVLRYSSKLVENHIMSLRSAKQHTTRHPQLIDFKRGIERLEGLVWGEDRKYKDILTAYESKTTQDVFDFTLQKMASNYATFITESDQFPSITFRIGWTATYELRCKGWSHFSVAPPNPKNEESKVIPVTISHVLQIYSKLQTLPASLTMALLQQAINNTSSLEALAELFVCLNLGRSCLNQLERQFQRLMLKQINQISADEQLSNIKGSNRTGALELLSLSRDVNSFSRQSSNSIQSSPKTSPLRGRHRNVSSMSLASMASTGSSQSEVYKTRPFKSEKLLDAINTDDVTTVKSICQKHISKSLFSHCGHGRAFNLLLLHACESNSAQTVKHLLNMGLLNPNVKNFDGETALHIACRKNHHEIVKLLVKKETVKVNAINRYGATPLHIACILGHTKVAEQLLKNDKANQNVKISIADALKIKGETIEQDSAWPKAVQQLESCSQLNRLSAWHCCCVFGHEELAKVLLKSKNDLILQKTSLGDTAIHLVCMYGKSNMVGWVVKKDKSAAGFDEHGSMELNPFQLAVISGNQPAVIELLAKMDMRAYQEFSYLGRSWSVMQIAIQLPRIEILVRLLESGIVDVNRKVSGETVLESVLGLDDAKHTTEIIDKICQPVIGLDLSAKNDDGSTVYHLAARKKNFACMPALLNELKKTRVKCPKNCMQQQDANGDLPLHHAVFNNDENMITLLCRSEYVDVNSPNGNGCSPLMSAVQAGYTARVKQLLAIKGINILHKDHSGKNALHLAAMSGHAEITKLILAHVTEPNINTCSMNSSGMLEQSVEPSRSASRVTKRILLASTDNDGMTALHLACEHEQSGVFNALLEGAEHLAIDDADDAGDKPLHIACRHNNLDTIRELMSRIPVRQVVVETVVSTPKAVERPQAVQKPKNKREALQSLYAEPIKTGNLRRISELNLETQNPNNNKKGIVSSGEDDYIEIEEADISIFNQKVASRHEQVLDAQYADYYVIESETPTVRVESVPVVISSKQTRLVMQRLPVKNSKNGETPLHSACRAKNKDAVNLLLTEIESMVSEPNSSGITAFNIACKLKLFDIATIIARVMKRKINRKHIEGDEEIHRLARVGNITKFNRLIANGGGVNTRNNAGDTALHIALDCKHYDVALALLNQTGVKVFNKNIHGEDELDVILQLSPSNPVLLTAAFKLIRPSLSFVSGRGHDILMKSITSGDATTATMIFEYIRLANTSDYQVLPSEILNLVDNPRDSNTLVHLAVANGHADLLSVLCRFGFSAMTVNGKRDFALHQLLKQKEASHSCFREILKFTDVDIFQINDLKQTALQVAQTHGKSTWLPELLGLKQYVTKTMEFQAGNTVKDKEEEESFVDLDVEYNGIDQRDWTGATALARAIRDQDINAVKCLLGAGARLDVAATYQQGTKIQTCLPIDIAKETGNQEIIKQLELAQKTQPYQVGSDGNTALHRACENGNLDELGFILSGIETLPPDFINKVNMNGDTALQLAIESGIASMVDSLLSQAGNIKFHQKNKKGETVFHQAFRKGNTDVINKLMRHVTPDILATLDDDDNTLLHLAAKLGDQNTFKTLLSMCKIDILHQANKNGDLPIHIACKAGKADFIKPLASMDKIQLNVKNNNGYSPIMLAVLRQHVSTVIALQEGANISLLNDELVSSAGNKEITSLEPNDRMVMNLVLMSYQPMDVFVVALMLKNDELVRCLFNHVHRFNIDLNRKRYNGHSLLHIAGIESSFDGMRIMLEAEHQQVTGSLVKTVAPIVTIKTLSSGEALVPDEVVVTTANNEFDDYGDITYAFDIHETTGDNRTLLHLVVDLDDEAKFNLVLSKSDITLLDAEMTVNEALMTAEEYAQQKGLSIFADRIHQRRETLEAEALERREKIERGGNGGLAGVTPHGSSANLQASGKMSRQSSRQSSGYGSLAKDLNEFTGDRTGPNQ